jgi:iron complex outermembrane receptor protein
VATGFAAILVAGSALANDQPSSAAEQPFQGESGLNEIVVTAQRRSENVQATPLAITAITGDMLEQHFVQQPSDLQFAVPNVSVGSQFGVNRIFIRGIGLTSEALGADGSTAFYVNGIVIARPSAQISSFYDVDRIEILRGPQGTLYGRNATAGLVDVITRQPTAAPSGYLNASFGNYNQINIEGAASGALDSSEKLLGRIAFQETRRDGFGRNLTTGDQIDDAKQTAIRATFKYLLADNANVVLTGDYSNDDSTNVIHVFGPATDVPLTGVLLGGNNSGLSRDVYNDGPNKFSRRNRGVSAEINADFGNISFKSLTAYRNFTRADAGDIDGTDIFLANLAQTEGSRQWSQEFQLNYERDGLTAVGGAYFFHESEYGQILTTLNIPVFDVVCFGDPTCRFEEVGNVKTDAYAGFAQISYELLPRLKVTGGLRYSSERKQADGTLHAFTASVPTLGRKTWPSTTPKFGVDYTFSDRTLLYASATKGFRAGVFNIGTLNPPINPETIWAYEAGVKTRLLDNRLQLNASVFDYNYSNLQVGRVVDTIPVIDNAASARNRGLELELLAAVSNSFTVNASFSYLDAKFTDYTTVDSSRPELGTLNLAGNSLPGAPKASGTAGFEYKRSVPNGGGLALRGDILWRTKTYFTEFNVSPTSQPGYTKINASLDYTTPSHRWDITLFVKNLTNRTVISAESIGATPLGFPRVGFLDDPRTYGIRFGFNFQ